MLQHKRQPYSYFILAYIFNYDFHSAAIFTYYLHETEGSFQAQMATFYLLYKFTSVLRICASGDQGELALCMGLFSWAILLTWQLTRRLCVHDRSVHENKYLSYKTVYRPENLFLGLNSFIL